MTSGQALQAFHPSAIADSIGEMAFADIGAFNSGCAGVFWSTPGGPSPWEMHPDTEELLQVLEGKIEVEVLPKIEGDGQQVMIGAGECLIVPRGCWHRQTIHQRSKEFYLTPGETLHSHAEDPRVE